MNKFKKEIRHTFRMTYDEWVKLREMSKEKGQTPSQWLRDRITQARIK